MHRLIRRITTALYALGVLGALTFGASQAFGRSVQHTCFYDGHTYLGACTTQPDSIAECTGRCRDANGPDAEGWCSGGNCCLCNW